MNPGFQLGDVVSVVSERPLGDDLPAVERRIDIVDRHTEDLDAVFQRLFDGMRPAACPRYPPIRPRLLRLQGRLSWWPYGSGYG